MGAADGAVAAWEYGSEAFSGQLADGDAAGDSWQDCFSLTAYQPGGTQVSMPLPGAYRSQIAKICRARIGMYV